MNEDNHDDYELTLGEKIVFYSFLLLSVCGGLYFLIWLIFYFTPTKDFFARHSIEPRTAAFLICATVFAPLFLINHYRMQKFKRVIEAGLDEKNGGTDALGEKTCLQPDSDGNGEKPFGLERDS